MKEIKRLARCEKGHFYDAGRYDFCPHCENTREISVTRLEPEMEVQEEAKASNSIPQEESIRTVTEENVSEQVPHSSWRASAPAAPAAEDDNLTVHFYQKTLGTEPVVGWLVCTEGVHLGQDFRIKSGRNFVGRSGTMDICLSGDTAVSRERHLIVTYDPKGNTFFVQPGDTSSALSYLNDKPLLEASAMKTGDKLTVGGSELMFVAFCGKNFTWKK